MRKSEDMNLKNRNLANSNAKYNLKVQLDKKNITDGKYVLQGGQWVGHIERDMNDMKGQSRARVGVLLLENKHLCSCPVGKMARNTGIWEYGQLSKVREMGKGIILEMQVGINKWIYFNFNLKALGDFDQDGNMTEYYEIMITL